MKIDVFKYFYPERPVLVHRDQDLVDRLSDDPNWIAELKYNGQKLELHVIDGKVLFYGRHGNLLKYHYDPSPELVEYFKKRFPKGYYLFSGELRHNKVVGVQHKIVLWDVFIYKNQFLYKEPYWARRAFLEKHFHSFGDATFQNLDIYKKNNYPVCLIYQFKTDFKKVFNEVIKEDELEGLVMKNLQGKLDLGRKSGPDSKWQFKIRKETGRHKF